LCSEEDFWKIFEEDFGRFLLKILEDFKVRFFTPSLSLSLYLHLTLGSVLCRVRSSGDGITPHIIKSSQKLVKKLEDPIHLEGEKRRRRRREIDAFIKIECLVILFLISSILGVIEHPLPIH
jgi:hypothetical protein